MHVACAIAPGEARGTCMQEMHAYAPRLSLMHVLAVARLLPAMRQHRNCAAGRSAAPTRRRHKTASYFDQPASTTAAALMHMRACVHVHTPQLFRQRRRRRGQAF
eukprot:366573-Chlamydomonas_euryale.AAC.11